MNSRALKSTSLALCVLACSVATQSQAGPLAPTKASQVVVLLPDGTECPGDVHGYAMRKMDAGNGTAVDFVIPAGQVLVVTGYVWRKTSVLAAGSAEDVILTSDAVTGESSFLSTDRGIVSTNATAGGNVTLSPGVIVQSGMQLCLTGGLVSRAYGFLAKDN